MIALGILSIRGGEGGGERVCVLRARLEVTKVGSFGLELCANDFEFDEKWTSKWTFLWNMTRIIEHRVG